jgi:hypothetical protein
MKKPKNTEKTLDLWIKRYYFVLSLPTRRRGG